MALQVIKITFLGPTPYFAALVNEVHTVTEAQRTKSMVKNEKQIDPQYIR